MNHYDIINEAVLTWARHMFDAELNTEFARAQTIGGHISKVVISALRGISREKLTLLARVLPLGVASTGPIGEKLREKLLPIEKLAVEEFQDLVQKVHQAQWGEFSSYIVRLRQKESLIDGREIKKKGIQLVKRAALEWKCQAEKIEPSIWALTSTVKWGRYSVLFDLSSTMQMTHGIDIFDSSGLRLRWNDHYLGVLGIGPSIWPVENVASCSDEIVKVIAFARWHLSEYENLLSKCKYGAE